LPIGAASWAVIAERFAEWAKEHNRPERDAPSLRQKWVKMLRSKPTGMGGYSERQLKFREIEKRAHSSAGGAILHDNDHPGDILVSEDDELDANAILDIEKEIDGLETKRISSHPPLFFLYLFCIIIVADLA
jgi:hypothetical protein